MEKNRWRIFTFKFLFPPNLTKERTLNHHTCPQIQGAKFSHAKAAKIEYLEDPSRISGLVGIFMGTGIHATRPFVEHETIQENNKMIRGPKYQAKRKLPYNPSNRKAEAAVRIAKNSRVFRTHNYDILSRGFDDFKQIFEVSGKLWHP